MTNRIAEQWLPAGLRRMANRLLRADIVYRGPFRDWGSAAAETRGYDDGSILERVSRATRRVLAGSASFEQDGSVSTERPPPSHALEGLLIAAALDGGRMSVLDFGGGLASHYLRWRSMLLVLPSVHWAIVEQSSFVAEGRVLFEMDPLVSFHEDITEVASCPNAVLASSVLQYVPNPYETLERLVMVRPRVVVLDRMPFGAEEAVVAQFVPSHLGKASYPLWVLTEDGIHSILGRDYDLLSEFDTSDHPLKAGGIQAVYRGSIWVRRA